MAPVVGQGRRVDGRSVVNPPRTCSRARILLLMLACQGESANEAVLHRPGADRRFGPRLHTAFQRRCAVADEACLAGRGLYLILWDPQRLSKSNPSSRLTLIRCLAINCRNTAAMRPGLSCYGGNPPARSPGACASFSWCTAGLCVSPPGPVLTRSCHLIPAVVGPRLLSWVSLGGLSVASSVGRPWS